MKRTLRERWLWTADQEFRGYSPIYDRIARAVADEPAVLDRLERELERAEQQPLLLLAAVHYLLLGGLDHPLAQVYAGGSAADPGDLFLDLVCSRTDAVLAVVRGHRTQTNEPGRAALLAPALQVAADTLGEPLALVEVGASGGVNLRLGEFRLDYGPAGATGPASSPVVIRCEIRRGRPPIAPALPALDPVLGLDRSPVDLTDPETARWLLACVWPDTGRLDRTRAAIDVARRHPVTVHRGDAVDDLPALAATLPGDRPLVIVTTWVMAYLPRERRQEFAALLAELGTHRPVAWVSAEGPGVVAGLGDVPDVPDGASVLGLVTHRGGHADPRVLGVCHPHGWWLDWRA